MTGFVMQFVQLSLCRVESQQINVGPSNISKGLLSCSEVVVFTFETWLPNMITGPYRMYCSLVSTISILFISVMAMASFLDLRGIAAFDEGQETETHKFEHLQRSIEGGIKVWLWSLVGVKKHNTKQTYITLRNQIFKSLLKAVHF